MKYLTYLVLSGLLAAPPLQAHEAPAQSARAAAPAPKLQAALRSLWHGHVVHTREYAIAIQASDTARSRQAGDAVVANAKQLGDAVAGFYGRPAGDRMLALLAGHWTAVKAMTDAERREDRAAANQAMASLTANAGEIAGFLDAANPYLPKDTVRGLLLAHGAHHAAQIGQLMRGDRQGEQVTWRAMQAHMDTIADAMAAALARQFPDKAG